MGPWTMATKILLDIGVFADGSRSPGVRIITESGNIDEMSLTPFGGSAGTQIRGAHCAVRSEKVLKWSQTHFGTLLAACPGRPRSAFGGCAPRDLGARQVFDFAVATECRSSTTRFALFAKGGGIDNPMRKVLPAEKVL